MYECLSVGPNNIPICLDTYQGELLSWTTETSTFLVPINQSNHSVPTCDFGILLYFQRTSLVFAVLVSYRYKQLCVLLILVILTLSS